MLKEFYFFDRIELETQAQSEFDEVLKMILESNLEKKINLIGQVQKLLFQLFNLLSVKINIVKFLSQIIFDLVISDEAHRSCKSK